MSLNASTKLGYLPIKEKYKVQSKFGTGKKNSEREEHKHSVSSRPFSDNVIQSINRFVLMKFLYCVFLILVERTSHFSHKSLEVSELIQQWLVRKKLDIFHIVVCLESRAALVHLLDVLGLVRVDAFENTQPPAQEESHAFMHTVMTVNVRYLGTCKCNAIKCQLQS